MIKYIKLFIFLIFIVSNLFATNEKYNLKKNIIAEFKNDFKIWGINFDEKDFIISLDNKNFLFDANQSNLNINHQIIIQDIIPRLIKILSEYKEIIDKIFIVATSYNEYNNKGYKKNNQTLANKRAYNVLYYILKIKNPIIKKNISFIKKVFVPVGIASKDKIPRKIKFAFKFKKKTMHNNKTTNKKVIDYRYILYKLYTQSPTILQMQDKLKSKKIEIDNSISNFKPEITLNSVYYDYLHSNKKLDTSQNSDISLKYNIFNGTQDIDSYKLSKINYKAKEIENKKDIEQIFYNIIGNIIEIKKSLIDINIKQKNIQDFKYFLNKVYIKYQKGIETYQTYMELNLKLYEQKIKINDIAKTIQEKLSQINKYIPIYLKEIESFNFSTIEKLTIDNIMNIKSVEENIDLEFENIMLKVKKKEANKNSILVYPTIDFVAKQSFSSTSIDNAVDNKNEAYIGVELKLPLYSGSKDYNKYKKSLNDILLQKHIIDEKKQKLKSQLYTTQKQLLIYMQKINNLSEIVKLRKKIYTISKDSFKINKIDIKGLIDAANNYYNMKSTLNENKYQVIKLKLDILYFSGNLLNFVNNKGEINGL